MHATDEKLLIEQAQRGELRAFESLYRLHSARVHGLCTRLCDNRDDAADAVQETFVKAWRALSRFKGESAFSTWLHRIAFNESMTIRKKYGSRERHLQIVDVAGRDDSSVLTEIEQLENAVAKLPERAREALVLHKIYGYTHEETADFMGTTPGASKAQVHRAMGLLRGMLPGAALDGSPPTAVQSTGSAASDE